MSHDLDRRLRESNFISADPDGPAPFSALTERLDQEPDHIGRRTTATRARRFGRPLALAAVGLTLTGTATAAVIVLSDSGPTTGLATKATPDAPASGSLTALLTRGAGPLGSESRSRFPELGDNGPVQGTTLRREGFDIDIAFDAKKICFSAHEPKQITGEAGCTTTPIPYAMIPLAETGNGPKPTRRLAYAIAPDGVSSLTVATSTGKTRRATFENNVAAIPLDGNETVTRWSWTLPDGKTITQ